MKSFGKEKIPEPIRFLLRVDSSSTIGFGHRTRIDAIACEIMNFGYEYRIVARKLHGQKKEIKNKDLTLWINGNKEDLKANFLEIMDAHDTINLIEKNTYRPDIIIVDSYELGEIWECYIREKGFFVVALDDFRDRKHSANLIVELLPPPCDKDRLCGIEFIPIDTNFSNSLIDIRQNNLRILLTFGGGDPTNHTEIALDAICEIDEKYPHVIGKVDVIYQAGSMDLIKKYMIKKKFNWYKNLPTISNLMKNNDVVITSAGNTMLEGLVAKRIVACLISASNQAILANYLNKKKLIYLMGTSENVGVKEIKNLLLEISNKKQKEIIERIYKYNLDTLGAKRLLTAIIENWKKFK